MYLPALARDLYKAQKEVEELESKFENAASVAVQEKVKLDLLQANAELSQLKKIMEGRKEQSLASLRKPKNRFQF
jgi:hypothetical protein